VWIEDAPGGGARFVVELPLDPEAAPVNTDVTSLLDDGTLTRDRTDSDPGAAS
jgi:hypothetical protein